MSKQQCSLFAPPPPSRADMLAAEAESIDRRADVTYDDFDRMTALRCEAKSLRHEAKLARDRETK